MKSEFKNVALELVHSEFIMGEPVEDD